MKVGLYFGSFNPIHVGHLIIASHLVEQTELEQIWFIVSPQNPLKKKKNLLADFHRLALVRVAIEDNAKFKASDIEFGLPKPSYTATTLAYIQEKYPDHSFSLIMGADNLRTFQKWKNYEHILDNHQVFVYPRVHTEGEVPSASKNELEDHVNVTLLKDVPMMKISSSFIRRSIADGKDVKYLLTEPVHSYVQEMNFYKF